MKQLVIGGVWWARASKAFRFCKFQRRISQKKTHICSTQVPGSNSQDVEKTTSHRAIPTSLKITQIFALGSQATNFLDKSQIVNHRHKILRHSSINILETKILALLNGNGRLFHNNHILAAATYFSFITWKKKIENERN